MNYEAEVEEYVENKLASDILIEFLEAAVHNVIYSRHIYPDSIFTRKKIYHTLVMVSNHQQLNLYIQNCLKCAYRLLTRKELQNITIIFQDKDLNPLESFIFDIVELHSTLEIDDEYLIKCEEALRACFLKLNASHMHLKPLPIGTTFQIKIQTTETALTSVSEDPMFKDFPWIEANETSSKIKNCAVVPVKSLDINFLKIQIYVEETKSQQSQLQESDK